jgi:hypothetical protein
MRRIHLAVLTTTLIASFCLATSAQDTRQPAKDPANRTQSIARDNEREREAMNTLLYLRSSANEIDAAADRVKVLLEIADALWLANKEIAIDVFKQSFNQAAAADAPTKNGDSLLQSRPLQQSVINRIAKRDPELARTLLLSTISEKDAAKQPNAFGDLYGVRSNHDEMLIEAASNALSGDPGEAAQIARTAAADGFSQPMKNFLVNLRAKDRAASDALFEQLLQNASSRSPKQLVEALFLWDYAFQRKSVYFGGVGWFRESPTEYPIRPDLKTKSLRFAVDALVENAQQFYLANANADDRPVGLERYAAMYSLAAQILPDVQAIAPATAPTIVALMNRLIQEMTEQRQKPPSPLEPLPASSDDPDIDELIERAAKAPNTVTKDALYARAAYCLYLREEYQRALEVARKIDNADLQLKVTEPLRFDWVGSLTRQNRLESALTVARAIETPEVRAAALVRLAAEHIQKRNQQQALAVLNEAEAAAGKARPSVYLASAMLGVAQLYLQLDNADQAQQTTSNAIQLMNAGEENERWGLLGKSSASQRVNAEWISQRGEGVSVKSTYPKVAGLLDVLSRIAETRLDAGLMLARDIKPKALNFATQAALCRQVVERAHAANGNAVKTAGTR